VGDVDGMDEEPGRPMGPCLALVLVLGLMDGNAMGVVLVTFLMARGA
jgi:hypothetical protein